MSDKRIYFEDIYTEELNQLARDVASKKCNTEQELQRRHQIYQDILDQRGVIPTSELILSKLKDEDMAQMLTYLRCVDKATEAYGMSMKVKFADMTLKTNVKSVNLTLERLKEEGLITYNREDYDDFIISLNHPKIATVLYFGLNGGDEE